MADLAVVEARLERILDPYRDRLEAATIYKIPTLRRTGAKAHDWFAFVRPASKHVSFFLMPIVTWPDLLDGSSDALLKRRQAKSAFNFSTVDEALFGELEALVARAFERYTTAR
ncbi:MAG TPA: hypothetical protein VI277_07170 [Candidatus Limnocylindria bacterium]